MHQALSSPPADGYRLDYGWTESRYHLLVVGPLVAVGVIPLRKPRGTEDTPRA